MRRSLLLLALFSAQALAQLQMDEVAKEAIRPAGSPDYADVSLRYGWIRSSFPSVQDAKQAITDFHATRVDWFYPGPHSAEAGNVYVTTEAQEFIDWCHDNDIEIVGAMSTLTKTAAWDSGAPQNGTRYRGDPNNAAYAAEAVKWGKALADAGVDAIIVDDFFGYTSSSDRQAFNDHVILAIKAHAPNIKIASNKGHTLGTLYVAPYDFDFHFSDTNFIPDPSDWWDAAKAHHAEQSAFLSHPNINMTNDQRRTLIGLGYAVGAHLMAPWDEWLSGGHPRLFADPSDFADLYGFAWSLGQAGYLNGFEDAAVGGYDLVETRYGANPPISITGGSGSLSAFARAKPGDTIAPVVIHLVDSGTPQAATLRVRIDSLFGTTNVQCALHSPTAYDQATHSTASTSGDYSNLRQTIALTPTVDGDDLVISIPALSPWSVLTIKNLNHQIEISPKDAQVFIGETQSFTATVLDPDGVPASPQPSLSWNIDHGGSIDANGLFTAGNSPVSGTVTATATLDGGEVVNSSQSVAIISGTERSVTARWPLNNSALDIEGDRDGALQGSPTYSLDRQEGSHSILLDGIDDYIDIADHPDLDVGTGDFSYSMWFKRHANAATNLRLISKGGQDNEDTGYCVYGSDTNITAALCNGNSRVMINGAHGGVGVWTHMAVTIDRSSGFMKLYIDGAMASQVDISSWEGQDLSSSHNLRIGRSSKSFIGWDGRVDDVRLYQRALSSDEVAALTGSLNPDSPTPSPMSWSTPPEATGAHSIRMVASTATDSNGVEYWFDEISGNPGGVDSGWQTSPAFTATGLQSATSYTYRVRVRDVSNNPNFTEFSATATATTHALEFNSWISHPDYGVDPAYHSPNDDPDGDGLSNRLEAFFGTHPGEPSTGIQVVGKDANTLTFQHPNPDTPLTGITGSYLWSKDLTNWYASDGLDGDGSNTLTTTPNADDPSDNTTTVTATLSGASPLQLFIRVLVAEP